MRTINTKFGTLYAERGVGFGYNLYDSNKELIQSYDNDMPFRWAKNLKKCETKEDFFDTLYYLIGEHTLVYETNKKRMIKETKEWFKGCDFCDNTFISEQTFRIGKYNVFVDLGGEC